MKKTVSFFLRLILFLGLQLTEQVVASEKLTRHESHDLVYFTEGEKAAAEAAKSLAQKQKNKRSIASVDDAPDGLRKPKALTTGESLDLQYLFNVRPEPPSP